MGQNIVLCWSSDERGLLVIFVPHYFLGNYCAGGDEHAPEQETNEAFIRHLISGSRRKSRDELFAVCERLDVAPTFIKLKTALTEEEPVIDAVVAELKPIRERAKDYIDDPSAVQAIIDEGCEAARDVARDTLDEVRKVMSLSR